MTWNVMELGDCVSHGWRRSLRPWRHTVNAFRSLLVLSFLSITGYTGVVASNHGMGLFGVFFGDMARFGWPGQFNLDFMFMLVLSGLWVAWRHRFRAAGLLLGLFAILGGVMFLSAYLLVASFRAGGDVTSLLLGENRAAVR
jgi:hypothetical protein